MISDPKKFSLTDPKNFLKIFLAQWNQLAHFPWKYFLLNLRILSKNIRDSRKRKGIWQKIKRTGITVFQFSVFCYLPAVDFAPSLTLQSATMRLHCSLWMLWLSCHAPLPLSLTVVLFGARLWCTVVPQTGSNLLAVNKQPPCKTRPEFFWSCFTQKKIPWMRANWFHFPEIVHRPKIFLKHFKKF